MELKEQIKFAISNLLRSEDDKSEWIERLLNDFIIGFVEWKQFNCNFIIKHETKGLLYSIGLDNQLYSIKQLLEIYKKELA